MTQLELMKDATYTNPELAEILKTSGPGQRLAATTDIPALQIDHEVSTRDGSKFIVRVYQGPRSKDGPALVWLHGGGFCLGGLENEELLCRQFCEVHGGVAFNVEYRLAPEHPFPIPVNDCYDALKWTAANANRFDADLRKGFIVGGISAGGNIAAVISHLYRDEQMQPPLTGVYLSIPATIDEKAIPEKYKQELTSRQDNKEAPVLDQVAMKLFSDNYAADPHSPLKSPLLFSTGHAGLPPTYFQICGLDPLRDDALIYERILREDGGIKTKVDLYPGLPHGFWVWWPKAEFSVQQQRDSIDGLGWLLNGAK